MSRTIRLCMIGAGGHASRNIYPNFYFLENAEVVANADLDEARASSLAVKCGIPNSYSDYRTMLQEQKPDGVMVCVSKDFHASGAIDIMKLGYHVYTEKPNAPDFAKCREVLAVARKTGKVCMVGYKKRFSPSYCKARRLICSDEFGTPSLLTVLRTKGPSKEDDPQSTYLLDWGCHAIDLLSYLFGTVARVQVFTAQGTTNSYAINLQFSNGAAGSLCLTNRPGPLREEVVAIGSRGVRIDVDNAINMRACKGDQVLDQNDPEFSCGSRNSNVEQGFSEELQAFVDAIRDGTQPASTIETATHTMAVYDAVLRSRVAGGTVTQVEET